MATKDASKEGYGEDVVNVGLESNIYGLWSVIM